MPLHALLSLKRKYEKSVAVKEKRGKKSKADGGSFDIADIRSLPPSSISIDDSIIWSSVNDTSSSINDLSFGSPAPSSHHVWQADTISAQTQTDKRYADYSNHLSCYRSKCSFGTERYELAKGNHDIIVYVSDTTKSEAGIGRIYKCNEVAGDRGDIVRYVVSRPTGGHGTLNDIDYDSKCFEQHPAFLLYIHVLLVPTCSPLYMTVLRATHYYCTNYIQFTAQRRRLQLQLQYGSNAQDNPCDEHTKMKDKGRLIVGHICHTGKNVGVMMAKLLIRDCARACLWTAASFI